MSKSKLLLILIRLILIVAAVNCFMEAIKFFDAVRRRDFQQPSSTRDGKNYGAEADGQFKKLFHFRAGLLGHIDCNAIYKSADGQFSE